MRRLLANTIERDILVKLPDARVTLLYDGPRGYELLVQHNGRHAEIRRRSDIKLLIPSKRRKA